MTTTTRRSDIVRARRQKRNSGKQRSQSTLGRNMPPTVARGVGNAQAGQAARARHPSRMRVDVPLKSPGAELRLPALPKVKLNWRVLSSLMVLGLSWLIYKMWTAPTFLVKEIAITNDQILESWEIENALQVVGSPVFIADPAHMEQTLRDSFPELDDVNISVGLPAVVTVSLTERTPLIYWKQDEVEVWVDEDGIAFPPRGKAQGLVNVLSSGIPGATPNELGFERLMMPEMVDAILKLQEQVPEGETMVYDSRHGLGWTDPRGWKVYFGQAADDMEIRLAVYKSLVDLLNKRNIKPALVSVEYIHAPYYRLKAGK